MLGAFANEAQDVILLAEDEARMLGRVVVEPEHLLIALGRSGRGRALLAEGGVTASDIRAAAVARVGMGDDLLLGEVPRSRATVRVLERAVDIAAERGVLGPGTEHLLLSLAADQNLVAAAILDQLGIDAVALVDANADGRREAVSSDQLKRWLLGTAGSSGVRTRELIPPGCERYTRQAQRAVRAATELAALLEHRDVQPLHLLLGCLHVPDGVAAGVLEGELAPSAMGTVGEAMERARMYGPHPSSHATGRLTPDTRRILAQGALACAYRRDDPWIGTGHLLLATLDAEDRAVSRIIGSGVMGSGPVNDHLARTLTRALPGDEQPAGDADSTGVIRFDALIEILTAWFRGLLPPGWGIRGSGRSDGVRLTTPDSHSEEDYAIHMGWIVTSTRCARERLIEVTIAALTDLQHTVTDITSPSWPSPHEDHDRPEPHVEITDNPINPKLRLYFGRSDAPAVEHPSLLLNQVLRE